MTMFMDETKINVKSGAGGDGSKSFRREKFVPFGGPDGGDGGRGGSVYLVADRNLDSLVDFRYKRHFNAGAGGPGRGRNKHGAKGQDIFIRVPPGTVVRFEGEVLSDLAAPGDQVMVARGGRGGLGNSHFVTSTRQAPKIAQKGEPGEERWIELELKLIADVGIIGYPNVGKSTFLAAVTRATPKVADYAFTTLTPNLGVAEMEHVDFVLADIPGLIQGASQGVGLGHQFLRHIERTLVLIHIVDGNADNPIDDFDSVNNELKLFNPAMAQKPQVVAFNKMDLPKAQENWKTSSKEFTKRGVPAFPITAAVGEGLTELLGKVAKVLEEAGREREAAELSQEVKLFTPAPLNNEFTVEREPEGFRVRGRLVERAAVMTDLESYEAVAFLERTLTKMGVTAALKTAGVQAGDTVFIGDVELLWWKEEDPNLGP
jgi:GTP-binding protein